MRTLRFNLCILTSALCLAVCCSTCARADKGAEDQLRKMIAANSLDGEGKAGFHIKIAFQYFDIDGKPVETGTAEEWWAGPDRYRLIITSPSANESFPAGDSQNAEVRSREAYLVHELMNAAVHPFPRYTTFEGLDARASKQAMGGTTMNCVLVETLAQKAPSLTTPTFCADPKSNALRLRSNLYASSITRNNIGIFHDVNVALDYQISYGSKQKEVMAIVGHVTAMQTFDPTQSQVALGARPADHYEASDIPELYIKGKALAQPFTDCYSETQILQENVRVALRGVITKDGSVTGVVAMASPNKGLADCAVSSVSMWKYKPFVVEEGPVEVYSSFYATFLAFHLDNAVRRPR